MKKLYLYFHKPPEKDRWFLGDRYLRSFIRRILRGNSRASGVEKVFLNLCKGLEKISQAYTINLPFDKLQPDDRVAILGAGLHCLDGYNKPNKIVAGIGLMTHPSEWPNLCEQYPVVKYLQHSTWANDIYKPYFGDKCEIWAVGIETDKWKPDNNVAKDIDFIIYNKLHWNLVERSIDLVDPIKKSLNDRGLKFLELKYGFYKSDAYYNLLLRSKAMIFVSEHESQGIAYQECLSTDVPVFAWDQGKLIDPNYVTFGDSDMPTSSVPFFDNRCGMKFKDFCEFDLSFDTFLSKVNQNKFSPREYILENLTLEKSAENFLKIIKSVFN